MYYRMEIFCGRKKMINVRSNTANLKFSTK